MLSDLMGKKRKEGGKSRLQEIARDDKLDAAEDALPTPDLADMVAQGLHKVRYYSGF